MNRRSKKSELHIFLWQAVVNCTFCSMARISVILITVSYSGVVQQILSMLPVNAKCCFACFLGIFMRPLQHDYNRSVLLLWCVFAEQYEAFLKFNHDQINRRFGETAASCKYSSNCHFTCIQLHILTTAKTVDKTDDIIYLGSMWLKLENCGFDEIGGKRSSYCKCRS